ncbi:hypothetical protein [Vibrio sp. SCSIO 43136]|uniref:hypothetical protein n=1 Tax=Vibrio sp. SCSIO 43136 TaxID=2819101 RepID=UPI002074B891|nr:hypothetical protein [Vibrio sp. SCSIO 43136]USD68119.1 hypothetical protein J4N39_18265 [Vibrio sp. SCSIO 43136]
MGLATNVERWHLPAAVGMATEAIRAKYNDGAGGGGFGAADREIGSKLDAGKVLSAIDDVGTLGQHLSDWVYFAYASPLWNRTSLSKRFLKHLSHDWAVECMVAGIPLQEKTFRRIESILTLIAGGLALEQATGAKVEKENGELTYKTIYKRSDLIRALVLHDAEVTGNKTVRYWHTRTRYYQTHWEAIQHHIDLVRDILMRYDSLSRKEFKKAIEKQNGSNYYANIQYG